MELTREIFDKQRRPRFGSANPERMDLQFWQWMIRSDPGPPDDPKDLWGGYGLMIRDGVLRSRFGPWRVRDLFKLPRNRAEGPIWFFDRMGRTCNGLADGRLVCVGGEHEDFYDPDFCIYNDVVVIGPADDIAIYGYPRDVFPPTDFHTACRVKDRIIIVGGLDYPEDRCLGQTPVYALDLSTWRIAPIETQGARPGWIFNHAANASSDGVITIRGGDKVVNRDGEECCLRNFEDFALDLNSGVWCQITSRHWRQLSIYLENQRGVELDVDLPSAEALVPAILARSIQQTENSRSIQFIVEGVPATLKTETSNIELVIQGQLAEMAALRLAEYVRSKTEELVGQSCVLKVLQ
jgi:hypothetical protein